MMKRISLAATTLMATPAFAAGGDYAWYSLNDTNFVVLIAFLGFVGVLLYFGVPKLLAKMLDDRAEGIKSEIEEARALREEAQTILASFERKHKEVEGQVAGIIKHAKTEAEIAAEAAKADLKDSIARRLQAAVDQIASAEQAAVREVKDKAVTIAIAAAGEVIAANMPAKDAGALIDDAIVVVGDKLH
ncbi:ATP F0F1 synthase subunit B [Rhodobacterales bacterium 52_120_T64]|nr:ATP F0F1 synthase subunit B [Rhodobacterales bacterium 52_120_T64]